MGKIDKRKTYIRFEFPDDVEEDIKAEVVNGNLPIRRCQELTAGILRKIIVDEPLDTMDVKPVRPQQQQQAQQRQHRKG